MESFSDARTRLAAARLDIDPLGEAARRWYRNGGMTAARWMIAAGASSSRSAPTAAGSVRSAQRTVTPTGRDSAAFRLAGAGTQLHQFMGERFANTGRSAGDPDHFVLIERHRSNLMFSNI